MRDKALKGKRLDRSKLLDRVLLPHYYQPTIYTCNDYYKDS